MSSHASLSKFPPKYHQSAEPNDEEATTPLELDQYPTEVLEAVLGILRARRQAERPKA